MRAKDGLRLVAGALLMAATAWGLLAASGFLSDDDSAVRVAASGPEGR